MQVHGFFNSSSSYRVRIALALKGIGHDTLPINLRTAEHRTPGYRALNPSCGVPTVVDGDFTLTQSMAIIDWLDERQPEPALIPKRGEARARVLEFANGIATDIHPINNMRVLRYLTSVLGASEAQKNAWYAHWIAEGLGAAEALLQRHGHGTFCFGDTATLADCCLIPQVANAQRMNCPLDDMERVMAVYRHAMQQPAFIAASPSKQPDYQA